MTFWVPRFQIPYWCLGALSCRNFHNNNSLYIRWLHQSNVSDLCKLTKKPSMPLSFHLRASVFFRKSNMKFFSFRAKQLSLRIYIKQICFCFITSENITPFFPNYYTRENLWFKAKSLLFLKFAFISVGALGAFIPSKFALSKLRRRILVLTYMGPNLIYHFRYLKGIIVISKRYINL